MYWFLAKIVYRIICGEGNHTAQFDEQLRLIAAVDEREALEKAYTLGMKEEDSFYNNRQKLVQWQFVNVLELHKINELIDGAELYSHIEEKENGELYTEVVHKKAEHLKANTSLHFIQTF